MNIGDKVRLIHSKEEGIVTKFLKNDVVEVEIEEGFKLPVLRKELAIVSKTEDKIFKPQQKVTEVIAPQKNIGNLAKADKGIFLAFLPKNEKILTLHLINNTDWDLPYSLTSGSEKNHRGLLGGYLTARSFQKSPIDLDLKDFDNWGNLTFQAFYYNFSYFSEKTPFSKKLRLRANTFFSHKKMAPILQKECFLFQLDAEEAPLVINPSELKEKMFESRTDEILPKVIEKPASTIDLHIEELTSNSNNMSNAQILELQLRTFELKFESAIASGMDEIIFIHGVGNGVLRQEIQKRLAGHKNVAWFQDAQKEKFGYGATRVKIK
ncbi:Smr protein/MutS2 [Emticicia oligotrophica DSM 17448]|uniref:Smr protein/MutS2 n=1 Tax=Emticicia oligotrophica (strain DSM 17448 / CIP 109782 / MTCC 6937 / GPTSA100-15) TaxID=929562 RepID=A0ABN4AUP9_EMTOG|nr:Smr/MutS family protein [Emticicia oligotrophica]AFK05341.1 Smr protein/MutS2 [Emticicia oligotrophica DSM 17448]